MMGRLIGAYGDRKVRELSQLLNDFHICSGPVRVKGEPRGGSRRQERQVISSQVPSVYCGRRSDGYITSPALMCLYMIARYQCPFEAVIVIPASQTQPLSYPDLCKLHLHPKRWMKQR